MELKSDKLLVYEDENLILFITKNKVHQVNASKIVSEHGNYAGEKISFDEIFEEGRGLKRVTFKLVYKDYKELKVKVRELWN